VTASGGHPPLGTGNLGVRIMQKDATDLIDDTQVGVTALHQDVTYQRTKGAKPSCSHHASSMPRKASRYRPLWHSRCGSPIS
jgi:hypothetical protein